MALYVQKSFLLVPLVMLFFLVSSSFGKFSMKISEAQVGTICSQATDHSFCFTSFKSNPQTKTLNLPDVVKFLVKYASREAVETSKQFKLLVGSTTDPQIKDTYAECSEMYGNAVEDFDAALKALVAKDIGSFKDNVSAVIADGVTCKDDLSSVKPSPQIKKIYDIEKLSNILLVISDMLPKM